MNPNSVPRVVFDTNTVLSALRFTTGKPGWLRSHWASGACRPLTSQATVSELRRVLAYPKFRLEPRARLDLLEDYLPFCEIVAVSRSCAVVCRDLNDQPFLDLADCGAADVLVSGDDDLLSLNGQTTFAIENPAAYAIRAGLRKS